MLKVSLPKAAPRRLDDIEAVKTEKVLSPWSGGGAIQSVGRVALMTLAYEVPDQVALRRQNRARGRRRK